VALQTTLATRYWLKSILMTIVCVVLGLWGIWDYVVAIPRAEMGAARATLLREVVQTAMATELGSQKRSDAIVLLNVNIEDATPEDVEWVASVNLFKNTLLTGEVQDPEFENTFQSELNRYGNITPPSKYDRPTQWLFIACLPFGFYYLWGYLKMKKKAGSYRLDDDGTLHTPEGSWQIDSITDIDMSRWIAKSGNARSTWIAKAIVEDAPPQVLDDYIYKDMHLIIGAIANRFYPDQWSPLARRVLTQDPKEAVEVAKED